MKLKNQEIAVFWWTTTLNASLNWTEIRRCMLTSTTIFKPYNDKKCEKFEIRKFSHFSLNLCRWEKRVQQFGSYQAMIFWRYHRHSMDDYEEKLVFAVDAVHPESTVVAPSSVVWYCTVDVGRGIGTTWQFGSGFFDSLVVCLQLGIPDGAPYSRPE